MIFSYPLHSSNEARQSLIPPFPDLMSVCFCVKPPTGHIALVTKEAMPEYLPQRTHERRMTLGKSFEEILRSIHNFISDWAILLWVRGSKWIVVNQQHHSGQQNRRCCFSFCGAATLQKRLHYITLKQFDECLNWCGRISDKNSSI